MPKTEVVESHLHPKHPRLRLEVRSNSAFYQAVARIDNRLRQSSTKIRPPHLVTAFRVAEEWLRRELRASDTQARQQPFGRILNDPTMKDMFVSYVAEIEERKKA